MSELGTHLDIESIDSGLRLDGELDAHTAPRLSDRLDALITAGGVVELHIAGVTFMDSSGLRVVIGTTERLRERGGDLVLVEPTDIVRRLLSISGLTEHLTITPA